MEASNIFINNQNLQYYDRHLKKQHFVGCDGSKDTLDFALYESGKDYRQFRHFQTTNDATGFIAMRKWLRGLNVSLKDCVIGQEDMGIYSEALARWCDRRQICFVMLHPLDVKNACSRGRNKTDKIDSHFIADYIYTMREKLEPSAPEPPVINRLRQLFNERRGMVKASASFKARLKTIRDKRSSKRLETTIEMLERQIKAVEKDILATVRSDETVSKNYDLLTGVPGVGMINALLTII